MAMQSPVLHLLCGKMAAGKSTLAADLASGPGSVLLSEDAWLSALFGDEMASIEDYLRVSARLRRVIAPHVADLLGIGVSVVLDFPANTVRQRAWMRDLVARPGVSHQLHFLDVPDEVCLTRLAARNASGAHPFAPSEAEFARMTAHFAPPEPEEGFSVKTYPWDG